MILLKTLGTSESYFHRTDGDSDIMSVAKCPRIGQDSKLGSPATGRIFRSLESWHFFLKKKKPSY